MCPNEFNDDETLHLIPKCSHMFHSDCIDAWLANHSTYPIPAPESNGLQISEITQINNGNDTGGGAMVNGLDGSLTGPAEGELGAVYVEAARGGAEPAAYEFDTETRPGGSTFARESNVRRGFRGVWVPGGATCSMYDLVGWTDEGSIGLPAGRQLTFLLRRGTRKWW
ncbi:hypothetical protein PIB30_003286 [Stylosanthes scabra]|uniref:RING-type E3 ubiquitin transferase n=1 Tax=Stylosanthes scabra TaxID=79078 RepID=A0ABU6S3S8_9FABA|nr:hypothetical protein [Stylosanthes scabra]